MGPITAINVAGNQLSALGQSVLVNAGTSFGPAITPADLTGLKTGDLIEVSGLADAGGAITATRIARASSIEPLQALGVVSNLDAISHTFKLNGLTVDYSGATGTAITAAHPANGDSVIASGAAFDVTAVRLTAVTVRLATDQTNTASGEHIEQEGLITRFTSTTDFAVGGTSVTTSANTLFEGGTAASLALNMRVEVSGTFNASGVLLADRVRIEQIAAIAIEAATTAVDTVNSTLTVLGVNVKVDANTRMEDKSGTDIQLFSLKDVNVGDTVLVRGYESPSGSGKVQAVRLERLPPATGVILRGLFTAATAPLFKILGISVDTTNAGFGIGESQQSLSSAAFFTQAAGQIVTVRGTFTGTTVIATDVRIDRQEDR